MMTVSAPFHLTGKEFVMVLATNLKLLIATEKSLGPAGSRRDILLRLVTSRTKDYGQQEMQRDMVLKLLVLRLVILSPMLATRALVMGQLEGVPHMLVWQSIRFAGTVFVHQQIY